MLNYKEFLVLACVVTPTSTIAVMAFWKIKRMWWASLGVLATNALILFYLPIRLAFYTPSSFDPLGDGFGIVAEFYVIGFIFGTWNLALTSMILLLGLEQWLERRRADK